MRSAARPLSFKREATTVYGNLTDIFEPELRTHLAYGQVGSFTNLYPTEIVRGSGNSVAFTRPASCLTLTCEVDLLLACYLAWVCSCSCLCRCWPSPTGLSMVTSPTLVPLDWASRDRKSTRLNSSHPSISYAVFCLKKKNTKNSKSRAPARPILMSAF